MVRPVNTTHEVLMTPWRTDDYYNYRSPPSLALVSVSCHHAVCGFHPQAFELATGDYLFEPHSGEDYSRDEGSCALPACFGS